MDRKQVSTVVETVANNVNWIKYAKKVKIVLLNDVLTVCAKNQCLPPVKTVSLLLALARPVSMEVVQLVECWANDVVMAELVSRATIVLLVIVSMISPPMLCLAHVSTVPTVFKM
jgi:hypothetical protein